MTVLFSPPAAGLHAAPAICSVAVSSLCFNGLPCTETNYLRYYLLFYLLGPFHGAIAVPSVTRCRCRRCRCRGGRCRGHRCAGGARQYR